MRVTPVNNANVHFGGKLSKTLKTVAFLVATGGGGYLGLEASGANKAAVGQELKTFGHDIRDGRKARSGPAIDEAAPYTYGGAMTGALLATFGIILTGKLQQRRDRKQAELAGQVAAAYPVPKTSGLAVVPTANTRVEVVSGNAKALVGSESIVVVTADPATLQVMDRNDVHAATAKAGVRVVNPNTIEIVIQPGAKAVVQQKGGKARLAVGDRIRITFDAETGEAG